MKKQLSVSFTKQVKKALPRLRKETKKELRSWNIHEPGESFYKDEKLLEAIPYSAYEYLLIAKRIKVDRTSIIEWLNDEMFTKVLDIIICHALRRLALKIE